MAERSHSFYKSLTALAGLLLTSAGVLLLACTAVGQSQPQTAQQTLSAEESAGDTAVKQGQLREAFRHYMSAFESLSEQTSLDADKALREKIIKVVLQLNPPPAIPQEAIRHAAYAQAAVQEAGKNADTSDLNDAATEIEKALRIAPWWAQAYFNLGEVLQKANRPGEAAEALQLYLLADPQDLLARKNGTNAEDVQMEIYKLQFEAKKYDQIVMEAAQAAGGEKLRSISTLELTEKGNIYSPQGQLAITVKWQVQYPDKVHSEIETPMGQMIQVTDGKSAWIQSPQGTSEVPAAAVGEFKRGILLFGGWGLYQQALGGNVKAQYLGQEDMDGKKADAVSWLASFGTIKLYFESATHLLIAAKFQSTGMQGTEDDDEHWSDFRAVEGLQFPFQSVIYRNGVRLNDVTVQQIHINPPLDPSLFQKPVTPVPDQPGPGTHP